MRSVKKKSRLFNFVPPVELSGSITACLIFTLLFIFSCNVTVENAYAQDGVNAAGTSENTTEQNVEKENIEIISADDLNISHVPLLEVCTEDACQVPILKIKGNYFDPSGMCSAGPLSTESNQAIRRKMFDTHRMGFKTFLLRIDWPGISPEPNRLDTGRVRDLLDYAAELNLKILISLELDRAPGWFFKGGSSIGRLMVSYLVDPEQEKAVGNDGDLRWANGTGVPIPYHPDTIKAVGNLIYSLYYSIKDENALLGWLVCGPVTNVLPGGGRNGVVGVCDYSPYTVNRYNETTGTPLMTYPLPRYSQGSRDQREEFRTFTSLRLQWKREAFSSIIKSLRDVDKDHLILVGMDPALNYSNDNGYLAMVQGLDATRNFLNDNVNGVVIEFRLASDSFDALTHSSESSAMHLALTINQVLRNGKLALVAVEPDLTKPPNLEDIGQIAYMIKTAGAYPIWTSAFLQRRGNSWSWSEQNAIQRTQPLALLPPPKRMRRGKVAILDLPQFYSSYYADQHMSLMLSLIQLAIHQRTGVVVEMIGVEELNGSQPFLQQYGNLIYLTPELLTKADAKSNVPPFAQGILYAYRQSGGIIEAVDPMLLQQYVLEDYRSPVLEDQLRTRYVHRGAPADDLHGADAMVLANDPYIFIHINHLRGSHFIDIKLAGWPGSELDSMVFVNTDTGDPLNMNIVSENVGFSFSPVQDTSYLYIKSEDFSPPIAKLYGNRKNAVAIAQQSMHMKRSMPAALLLAGLIAVIFFWLSFQTQHRSLLRTAELTDRRRRIEPLDMLDDAEVMAFYKTYISDGKERSPDEVDIPEYEPPPK